MRTLLVLLLLVCSTSARAEWLEASSAHFVIYADDSEADIRTFSEHLERYHSAMSILTGLRQETPSPSNRVTVFVVRSARDVQRLAEMRNVYGFYRARAAGSVAFVPRITIKRGEPDFSMIALLHEYAHHFLISTSIFDAPRWFNEGGAEFFASSMMYADGTVETGRPAYHRVGELTYSENVTVSELLDPDLYEKRSHGTYDAFYGKSWLLYHYLMFSPDRRGQMREYLKGLVAGKSSRSSAEVAFGDLRKLELDLKRYMSQRKLAALKITPDKTSFGSIDVRPLSAGEVAMMPVVLESRNGVDQEEAVEVVARARAIAAAYPNDPRVLAALAEAEFDADNDDAAIAAADAALAIDPTQRNAYVQKGYALFRRAPAASDPGRAYEAALQPFVALNKLENDHPLPLLYYYRSFVERGVAPSETALRGLERAAELAPFDPGLKFDLAIAYLNTGDIARARSYLVPVAYNPHGGAQSDAARQVIDMIADNPDTTADGLLAVLTAPVTEAIKVE